MSNIQTSSDFVKRCGIIAILRGDFSVEDLLRIGDALLTGTVTVMEITLNSPSVFDALPQLRERFGDEMLIGAGTVRDTVGAHRALEVGAQFLVSPNFDPETATFAQSQDILHLPGVFTPSEAQAAFAAGCRMLKLFPMEMGGGPAYLRILRAPLDDVDFVPTGGVSLENIGDYARAGAAAVGLGSKLVTGPQQPVDDLVARAVAFRRAWQQGQQV